MFTTNDVYDVLFHVNCTRHNSETLPVSLRNCVLRPGSSDSGIVALYRQNNGSGLQNLLGTAVYRLRVTGPDGVWLLEPTYCRQDVAFATYALSLPGRYSVEVLLVYTEFSFVKPGSSKAVAAPWAGYLTLDVGHPAAGGSVGVVRQTWTPAPDTSVFTNIDDPSSAADTGDVAAAGTSNKQEPAGDKLPPPLCADTGPLPGRWRFGEWPTAAAAPLLRTCIWGNSSAEPCNTTERWAFRHDHHPASLYWQPYGCRMRSFSGLPAAGRSSRQDGDRQDGDQQHQQQQYPKLGEPEPITPSACVPADRHVCFMGDSHLRYLHNSFVMWLKGFRAADVAGKEVLVSDNTTLIQMVWGRDWPEPGGGGVDPLSPCTDAFVNFGQWPASHQAGAAPESAANYSTDLLYVRQKMLDLRHHRGVRVFWVTTSMPSLITHLELANVDWRTDPELLLYNRLAEDVMAGTFTAGLGGLWEGEESNPNTAAAAAAIPLIDTWSSSRILHDATLDGSHFENTGLVGAMQLTAALHALCSETAMTRLRGERG